MSSTFNSNFGTGMSRLSPRQTCPRKYLSGKHAGTGSGLPLAIRGSIRLVIPEDSCRGSRGIFMDSRLQMTETIGGVFQPRRVKAFGSCPELRLPAMTWVFSRELPATGNEKIYS